MLALLFASHSLTRADTLGYIGVVEAILGAPRGCNVNALGWKGRTAMMRAAVNGHLTVIQRLLDKGLSFQTQSKVLFVLAILSRSESGPEIG